MVHRPAFRSRRSLCGGERQCRRALMLTSAVAAGLGWSLISVSSEIRSSAFTASGRSFFGQRSCHRMLHSARYAEDGDPKSGLIDGIRNTFKVSGEQYVDNEAQVETPLAAFFGWGDNKEVMENGKEFIDSSDEKNYVTVTLEKPLGIGLAGSTPEGGVMVSELKPGSNAEASGQIQPGYQLIAAGGKQVHGMTVEEAMKPVMDSEGPVSLTFSVGDAEFFYGDLGPSEEWLSTFMKKLLA